MSKRLGKIFGVIIAVILIVGAAAGCNATSTTTTSSSTTTTTPAVTTTTTQAATTREITDLAGNTYTIPTPELLQRVAVLHTPIVQDIYIVGAGEKLVALSPQAQKWWLLQRMDPRVKTLPVPRSAPGQINLEELMKADPQLCIGLKQDHDAVVNGTNLICLETASRTGTYLEYQEKEIRFFGEIFGKQANAELYCSYLEDIFALIKERVATLGEGKKIRVLTAMTNFDSTKPLGTYGGGSYMQEWIELAGCENVAIDVKSPQRDSFVMLTMEQMLAYDPDIVLIDSGTPSVLTDDPVWQQMPAVKAGRVYRIPAGMFIWNRPCAEGAAQFPVWLAMTAYPQLFPDMTPISEVKRFFKEIFNYTLTDEDANKVLNPS
jgi:iron complex transport system substrate-binding protein